MCFSHLPLDIKKVLFSFITDPLDVINLMNVNKETKELIANNCEYFSAGRKLDSNLISKFQKLSKCDSIIKTNDLYDLQTIINHESLKSAKIMSNYDPFIHITKQTEINLARLQWYYYNQFLLQYYEKHATFLSTHFDFVASKYPIRNIGIQSTPKYNSFYLNSTFHPFEPKDIFASHIIKIVNSFISITAIITNLTFLDFNHINTPQKHLDQIVFTHLYVNENNIGFRRALFEPLIWYKQLQKIQVTIDPKIRNQYVKVVERDFDTYIRFRQEFDDMDDVVYPDPLKLDIPLTCSMVDNILRVFPNLLLISLLDDNDETTILKLATMIPKIKLYTLNVSHYQNLFRATSNIKVVPFIDLNDEMDQKFLIDT